MDKNLAQILETLKNNVHELVVDTKLKMARKLSKFVQEPHCSPGRWKQHIREPVRLHTYAYGRQ